jgi:hypothetical protein
VPDLPARFVVITLEVPMFVDMRGKHQPLLHDPESLISLDVARLITQCALLCIGHEDCIQDAQAIVDGLQPAFGEYAAVAMARATIATARGNYADALKILDRLSVVHPDFSPILCSLAMLKKELGLSGWSALAQKVVALDNDSQASAIASAMLAEAPKFLTERVPPLNQIFAMELS